MRCRFGSYPAARPHQPRPRPPHQGRGPTTWRTVATGRLDTGRQDVTNISKRLRFEVFRRDNHACRYCGATAPEAKLTIDHVLPVALGGTHEPGNLVTACSDCNSGKSAASPDAQLVADVSADAVRWGRAMTQAADILMREYRERADLHNRFAEAWNRWGYGPEHDRKRIPIDDDWKHSVDSMLSAGLPLEVLLECIDLAMAASHVKPENTFRYMCGIAWRKVTELREIAGALLEADQET